jgi:hypothetical protein
VTTGPTDEILSLERMGSSQHVADRRRNSQHQQAAGIGLDQVDGEESERGVSFVCASEGLIAAASAGAQTGAALLSSPGRDACGPTPHRSVVRSGPGTQPSGRGLSQPRKVLSAEPALRSPPAALRPPSCCAEQPSVRVNPPGFTASTPETTGCLVRFVQWRVAACAVG